MARRESRRSRESDDPITDRAPEDSFAQSGIRRGNGIGGGSMTNQVAVFVVIIATLGAIFAYLGNAAQANANLFKSEAAQKRSEAATHLSDFQARRTDRALSELARDLAPQDRKAALQARADAFKEEQDALRAKAQEIETVAAAWEKRSNDQLQVQHRWIEAVIALQIAIVFAAIALMTRKRWLEYGMLFMGLIGLSFGTVAALYG